MSFTVLEGLVAAKIVYEAVSNFLQFWNSDEWVINQFQAVAVSKEQQPVLVGLVEELAQKAEVPVPKVFVMQDQVPNAFACGRNDAHAAIVVTSSLIDIAENCAMKLDQEELEGILAHEMTHIKNSDTLISTAAAFIAGAMTALVPWGATSNKQMKKQNSAAKTLLGTGAVLATAFIAEVMQMAVSKEREFKADEGAGYLTGKPDMLANALMKMERITLGRTTLGADSTNSHMFILDPLGDDMDQLFSTHPTTAQRVERLRAQAIAMGRDVTRLDENAKQLQA